MTRGLLGNEKCIQNVSGRLRVMTDDITGEYLNDLLVIATEDEKTANVF